MDALEELIAAGPDPAYTVKRVVLLRYQDMLKARQLMRKWVDITVALGFEAGQWRQVAASFRRVDAGVKSGKLLPGKVQAASTMQRPVAATEKRPLPGKIPVGDGDAMNAALAAKGLGFK